MAFLNNLDEERKRRARIAGADLVANRLKRDKPRWLKAFSSSVVKTEAQLARNLRRLPNSNNNTAVQQQQRLKRGVTTNWPPPPARTCACH